MTDNEQLSWLVFVFIALALAMTIHWTKKSQWSVGLPFMYLSSIAMNHLFGAIIYTFQDYQPQSAMLTLNNAHVVLLGFQQTIFAVVGLVLGYLLIAPAIIGLVKDTAGAPVTSHSKIPYIYLQVAIFVYFFVGPVMPHIASFGTLISSGWILISCSVSMILWQAHCEKKRVVFLKWFMASVFFFPLFTMLTTGFLGFGIMMVLITVCFTGTFYRPRWHLVIVGFFCIYLGLTFFVNYFAHRELLREAVWGGRDYQARTQVIKDAVHEAHWFNPHVSDDLEYIDGRLNQNVLVGYCVDYMQSGEQVFAKGKTLLNAALAMIPRIIWPNKPYKAGSGSMVSDYTGIGFEEGTSVGVGHVMEFYINFGSWGVFFGFLLIGTIITIFDRKAGVALRSGHWKDCVFWMLPGIGMIDVVGSLGELTSKVAASYVFIFLINKFFIRQNHSRIR